MDPPVMDMELNQKKMEEVKDGALPSFCCEQVDSEVVYKIAQVLVPGLASACVDNTTGGPFKGPALVAPGLRKEMVDYLTERSESYVAESVVQEGGPDAETCSHPTDIVQCFIDDFVSSKRNLFSRVSSWLLSERREDKIDEFVQEMEASGFWLLDAREAIARTLLRNIDFKDTFHCNMKFYTAQELSDHGNHCPFRSLNCRNEGCTASICAMHMEKHDSLCPFKLLRCEQNCPDSLMRHEMDKHCITICAMKLVNCPFYSVGCRSTIPKCTVEQHCQDFLLSHVLHILQGIHKDSSKEDLKRRLEQLQKTSSSISDLSDASNLRSLISAVKKEYAKLGPLEHNVSSITVDAESKEPTGFPTPAPHEPDQEDPDQTPSQGHKRAEPQS